ncbi:AAA family ATPase [Candidatus Roizmanbacteria bacterium]|nr:AAA family ATPase [Candidatus Roizmanbacteria bacterium]
MKYNKITISGKICTGKTTLLRYLEKRLKWPAFMTGQLFRDYASKQKLNLEGAEEQSENLTKVVDYKVRDMLHAQGNLIVDGWMSGLMANKLPDILKILLICKDDIRYKRFSKREKIALKEAKEKVEDRQNSWFVKIKKIHKINVKEFTDKKNYNLIIDTSYITPQAVLKQVLEKMK